MVQTIIVSGPLSGGQINLKAAINRFIKEHNEDPRPFIWKADPNEIIAAVRRGHQVLESIH
ncbi:putative transposase for insertion sequence NGRIS-9 [Sphingomonas sp. LH128]|nr:putative transposase for insertion sequence NGRIS-9 [Sphingomonas sp. LH128]